MTDTSRRLFLKNAAMGSASIFLPAFNLEDQTSRSEYVTAATDKGKIRGIRDRGVNIYKGIPYAGQVSGKYRFGRPVEVKPWKGTRDALRLGNPAIQNPNSTYGIDEPAYSEDCLFLNVWTPANSGKRPVMFYNHGGGYSTGSGGSVAQDGANLARYFDTVVVETNHRLNIFGFLYLGEIAGSDYKTSGNNGLLDIIDGLKWVNSNIANFGGDPKNVMIFGESGGGSKTSCLYAMPDAANYFNKASIESGPGIRMAPIESAALVADILLKELGIQSSDWRKLLELPADQIFLAQGRVLKAAASSSSRRAGFSPVVDGLSLPANPFDPTAPEISIQKPLLVGWNEDEFTFFGAGDTEAFSLKDFGELYRKLEPRYGVNTGKIIDTYRISRPDASPSNIYVEIQSFTMMGQGSVEIAEKKYVQNGAPVFLYNFGYKSENKVRNTNYPMGTPHAMDIAFKFNNVRPDGMKNASGMAGSRPESFIASRNFAELWANFARNGNPSATGQPEWPAYDLSNRPTYRIDSECEVIYNRNKLELELWKSLGLTTQSI